MIQKIFIGILFGTLIGMFITSLFLFHQTNIIDLFLTKITATSIVTGVFCGIYAHLSKSKLQVFLISIIIGSIVFYTKYLITGHHFDPLTMGIFVGAMLGGTFAIIKKVQSRYRTYKRFKRLRKS
ncbi:hypothetical protein [Polaribacter aquimarinus]|uniref:Uncharacterized protein n=1 Tax=Polaribacter aquimarinus TaxID=2100726 RepID=A0A2U2JCX5_9FLAO|nr:hypothetical protein [Polaribacter aquimarinus]PWG06174.1 hypothetical protein DIS07_07025 [Polaribacter aquimarinus]